MKFLANIFWDGGFKWNFLPLFLGWTVQMEFLAIIFGMDSSNEISCQYFGGGKSLLKIFALI
ncbi:hypothetical protein [Hallerella porci]|uniref:Uncharacterized protein n=1 Tax=Hallerella porci TaxID=1945871 RepID=A0ABX5LLN3_9BACT|nr:hypothetical protein [Hallerella porci]PWK93178.1 hypothetical protein B0H50_1302 [Hallerella porci]